MPPDHALGDGPAERCPQYRDAGDLLGIPNGGDAICKVIERLDARVRGVNDAEPRRQRGDQIEAHVVDQFKSARAPVPQIRYFHLAPATANDRLG